jgi:hypothetical protein
VGANELTVEDADDEDEAEDEEDEEVLGATRASEPTGHAQRLRSAVGVVRPAHAKHCASSAGTMTEPTRLALPAALTTTLVPPLALAAARGSRLVLTRMLIEFAPHGAQKKPVDAKPGAHMPTAIASGGAQTSAPNEEAKSVAAADRAAAPVSDDDEVADCKDWCIAPDDGNDDNDEEAGCERSA